MYLQIIRNPNVRLRLNGGFEGLEGDREGYLWELIPQAYCGMEEVLNACESQYMIGTWVFSGCSLVTREADTKVPFLGAALIKPSMILYVMMALAVVHRRLS